MLQCTVQETQTATFSCTEYKQCHWLVVNTHVSPQNDSKLNSISIELPTGNIHGFAQLLKEY
jgi:hypothetical protein